MRSSTQISDTVQQQQYVPSKVAVQENDMSPTLPWPQQEDLDSRGANPRDSHLGDQHPLSVVSDVKSLATQAVVGKLGNYPPEGLNRLDLEEEPGKTNSMPASGQRCPTECQPVQVQPALSEKARDTPLAAQSGEFKTTLPKATQAVYTGEGQIPKLATADSCVVEGIPDIRSDTHAIQQQSGDLKSQSNVQEVLPPGPILRSSPSRERKSRSVSVNKRGFVNKARPAAFARSVSPTISKFQVECTREQLKSRLPTTPHKQKGSIARNKNHMLHRQVDVSKPVAIPVPPDVEMSPRKTKSDHVDADIVDLVQKLCQEEQEEEALMKADINDAIQKWCSLYPTAHQSRVSHVAFKFRLRISSTICFLVAAYRLLAKAPWTTNMIAVDIKQAALYAISKGWSLKNPTAGDFPFTVAELAVAAATYMEQIPPGVPEDPFYALFVMLGFLPPECSKLFSTVTLTCPHCLATITAPCPFFNTHVTWTMSEWVDLATALTEATLHPWVQSQGWHAEGCNMREPITHLQKIDSWVLLQLQPEKHDDYPLVRDSMHLAKDRSLQQICATVNGFLCSNSKSQHDRYRHYWVVEFENGVPKYAFDLLQGKQRLTAELAKKLRVFGVLLNVGEERIPFLRTRYLDEAAGILPAVTRGRGTPLLFLVEAGFNGLAMHYVRSMLLLLPRKRKSANMP